MNFMIIHTTGRLKSTCAKASGAVGVAKEEKSKISPEIVGNRLSPALDLWTEAPSTKDLLRRIN